MKKMNKHRGLLWLATALLLLLPFQNCGQSFMTTGDSASLSSQNGTDGLPTNPDVIPCLASEVGTPVMVPSNMTAVQAFSGRGAIGGRVASTPFTIQYTKSNAPAHCQQGVTVQCTRMAGSTVTALDPSGTRTPVNNVDVSCQRSPQTASPGTSISISFRPNDNDTDKQCFEGTATYQISLRSSADTNKSSISQTVTVTFKNNCYPEQITTESLDAFDQLGTAVAVDGGIAAIVAPGDDGDSNQTQTIGAIYIYKKGGDGKWTKSQTLRTDDTSIVSDRGASGDNPASVALKNGTLVVGSEFSGSNTGAVYVFKNSGGVFSQTRKIAGPVAGGKFGRSVATDGAQIAIGAPAENSSKGTVYVFDANTYAETAEIPSPLGPNGYFGAAVAIENALLAVGAPGSTLYRDTMTGDLVIYRKSTGWSEVTSNPLRYNPSKTDIAIKDPTGKAGTITIANGAELGASVAILNGTVIVGSPGFLTGAKKTGLALILSSDLVNLQTLTDTSGGEGRFGSSVALGSAGAIVGAPELRLRAGAIDHFALSNGNYKFVRRISSSHTADNDQFGFGVAISGNDIVAGAKLNAEPNNASGSASFISTIAP